MNKKITSLVMAIILVGAGAFFVLRQSDDNNGNNNSTNSTNNVAVNNSEEKQNNSQSKVVNDACAVFSASDIGTKLGVTLNEGSSEGYKVVYNSDNLPTVQCEWEEGDGATPSLYTVHLDVESFADQDKATTDLNDSKITGGSLSFEQLNGVADDAIYARSGTGTPVQALIYWRDGSVVYHLSAVKLSGLDRPTVEAQLKSLVQSKF